MRQIPSKGEHALRVSTAKWVFVIGTLSSLIILLGLTVQAHREVPKRNPRPLNAQVIRGQGVWRKYLCNDCHTILGIGGYYAPDMTKVWSRYGGSEDALKARILHPELFSKRGRKMPNQGVSEQ